MSSLGPGLVPRRIIACGKINLDKLETALYPYTKQSGNAHFSTCFFVSGQPVYKLAAVVFLY